MATCPSCSAGGEDGRYCSNCGASLEPEVWPLAPLRDQRDRPGPAQAWRERRRTLVGGLALAGLVVAGLVAADRVSNVSDALPSPTSAPTVTSTLPIRSTTTSASTSGPKATTEAPWPETVAMPPSTSGAMVLGFIDGTVATLDLASGELDVVTELPLPAPSTLVPLGDHVLVAGNNAPDGELRRVSLIDGSVEELGVSGWPVAADGSGAVVSGTRSPGSEQTIHFMGRDGSVTTFDLPSLHWPVTVARGQVLVQVQGWIGAYDPSARELVTLADGQLLAANEQAVARTVCTVGHCELRGGPWAALDRHHLDYELGDALWGAQLSVDGTRLLFRRPMSSSEPPDLVVLDLESGEERPLNVPPSNGPDQLLQLTADGRHGIGLGGQALVFHPLDGGRALRSGDFPKSLVAAVLR